MALLEFFYFSFLPVRGQEPKSIALDSVSVLSTLSLTNPHVQFFRAWPSNRIVSLIANHFSHLQRWVKQIKSAL